MNQKQELAFLRLLAELNAQLDGARQDSKILRTTLRLARDFFDARAACVARYVPDNKSFELELHTGDASSWDEAPLRELFRGRMPKLPEHFLIAPVPRRSRAWVALALRRDTPGFTRSDRRLMSRLAAVCAKEVERLDELRASDVLARLDRKIMVQLRPKDLFYHVLDGLESLTGYDHSAALFSYDAETGTLELIAEKIVWRKARSERIGRTAQVAAGTFELLRKARVVTFDRRRGEWHSEPRDERLSALAAALEGGPASTGGKRREHSFACAPLEHRGTPLGLIKVASCHPGFMGRHEAELLARFVPQAAAAMRNLARSESLELGILEAEKKHAVANLARGVSHDINNAFGATLPLVQQMILDVRGGEFEQDVIAEDLEHIEASLQACRRIFGGMLSFAKSEDVTSGGGNVRRAIDSTLSILADRFRRCAVEVEVTAQDPIPLVRGRQGDLEQLFLNLATNAVDALPKGGKLTFDVSGDARAAYVKVSDTGEGIAPEILTRIQDPFFTTKPGGNGLGLSVCRSVVWSMGGKIQFESEVGVGTCVSVKLPAAARAGKEHSA